MTNPNLNQAREWAKINIDSGVIPQGHRVLVASEIIQSLPDQWVDAEKVREIIEEMDQCLQAKSTTDFSKGIDNATTCWRDALKALITPKLPTLADMTQEEREACQWMQCSVADRPDTSVLFDVGNDGWSWLLCPDGDVMYFSNDYITPLPDLPKLEWPDDGVVSSDLKKLSTQQDYRNAPVGTVVKASGDEGWGLNVIVKDAENMWTNTSLGLCRTDFNMSGDIREVVTVIEVK